MADPAENQVQIENLANANREVVETACTLEKDMFDYFEKFLSPELSVKWQWIVKEQALGVDHVSLTRGTSGRARSKDFTTSRPCYFIFAKFVAPQDAAEVLGRYMTTKMVLNMVKHITIKQGVRRVTKMDKALSYHPYLKHKEGLPTVMTATNLEYTKK